MTQFFFTGSVNGNTNVYESFDEDRYKKIIFPRLKDYTVLNSSLFGNVSLPVELQIKVFYFLGVIWKQKKNFRKAKELIYLNKWFFKRFYSCFYNDYDVKDFYTKMICINQIFTLVADIAVFLQKRSYHDSISILTMRVSIDEPLQIIFPDQLSAEEFYDYHDLEDIILPKGYESLTGKKNEKIILHDGIQDEAGFYKISEFHTPVVLLRLCIKKNFFSKRTKITQPVFDEDAFIALEFMCKDSFGQDFKLLYLGKNVEEKITINFVVE